MRVRILRLSIRILIYFDLEEDDSCLGTDITAFSDYAFDDIYFKLPSQYLKTIHGYQKIPEVKLRLNKQLQKIKRGFKFT